MPLGPTFGPLSRTSREKLLQEEVERLEKEVKTLKELVIVQASEIRLLRYNALYSRY